jgi:hypothetical protein
MSYSEKTNVANVNGVTVNPSTEDTLISLHDDWNDIGLQLERMLYLLKPLGIVTGLGSNRLSVDINSGGTIAAVTTVGSITTLPTLANVTTVATVSSVTNQANIGNVNAFSLQQAVLRNSFANGISNNLVFS